MKQRITSLFAVAVMVSLLGAPAWANLLYDNGSINAINGYSISSIWQISDSFTLSSASNLTDVQIGLWYYPNFTPTSVDWLIGTAPFLSDISSGTGNLTNVFQGTNTYGYDLYESTFSLSAALGGGTYWLTLLNAVGTDVGNLVYWDNNNGPSQAWGRNTINPNIQSQLGSESFQIYGTTSAVPEPTTMLLLGSGLIGLAGYGRKKFFKK